MTTGTVDNGDRPSNKITNEPLDADHERSGLLGSMMIQATVVSEARRFDSYCRGWLRG